MNKYTIEEFVVIATEFKNLILGDITQKEFDRITNSDKAYKLDNYFDDYDYIFTENDDFTEQIIHWNE